MTIDMVSFINKITEPHLVTLLVEAYPHGESF